MISKQLQKIREFWHVLESNFSLEKQGSGGQRPDGVFGAQDMDTTHQSAAALDVHLHNGCGDLIRLASESERVYPVR
jgi:hypothetical protein